MELKPEDLKPALTTYDIALLASCWLGGWSYKEILEYYPSLTQDQLDQAHKYTEENWSEIGQILGEV